MYQIFKLSLQFCQEKIKSGVFYLELVGERLKAWEYEISRQF